MKDNNSLSKLKINLKLMGKAIERIRIKKIINLD